MGASSTASVARASPGAPAGASAASRSAMPAISGLPAFMTVTSGGKAQGQIEAMKQQEQTEDRSVAEDLADRIGQTDARETMQAEDARQAAKTTAAQENQSVVKDVAADSHEAVSRAQAPEDSVSRAEDGNGLVGPGGTPAKSGDEQTSEEEGKAQNGGSGGGAGGGSAGGGAGGHGGGKAEGGGKGAADAGAGGPATAGADGAKGDGASGGAGGGKSGADGPTAEDVPRDGGPAEAPGTDAGALGTDDLVLIDVEIAEHQRWAAAEHEVGAAGSMERAEFIAQTAGGAFIGGVASGAAMGLEMGLISRAVPQLGAIMGGKQALDSLLERDWDATGATIGKFGKGSDVYDTLANTLASVNEVITIANNICDYIGGIVAVVEVAAIAVAAGSAVLAFFTFGATAGIAIEAGELADVCEEIREAVGEVSTILNEISNHLLQPCILLFRALHEFTADADPREIEAGGHELSGAAGAVGGALGGWIGGQAAHIGGHAPPNDGEGTQQRPPHETPAAPEGLAPEVHFQEPAASTELPGAAPGIDAPAPAAQEHAPMQVADSEILPPEALDAAAPATPSDNGAPANTDSVASSAAPAAAPQEQLDLPNIKPVGKTGGKLEAPVAPISLKSFGSGGPVPKGLEPGAVGTYEVGVANPHPVALESNPPGAPGATRGGGRMPQEGREAAGVYGEHQAPAATMGLVLPGYEYAGPNGEPRAGSGTKEALAISFPKSAKRTKDRLDRQLHKDVKTRQANGEDVMWSEVVARGARNSRDAVAASGAAVPQEQISKAFLAEMETFQSDPKFGYTEFRPERGDTHPADSDLRGLTDAEISDHVDNLFGEFVSPMPPKGGQFEMLPGAPKPPTGSPPAPATNDAQLSIPGTDQPPVAAGQGNLFAPRPATPEPSLPAATPMQIADQPATRGVEPLSADHRRSLYEKAVAMGHDPAKIAFTDGPTEFDPNTGELRIGPNVVPLPESQRPARLANPANAELDEDSVLAHEIVGHGEAAQGKASRPEGWHEELQASVRAALLWEQATPAQRSALMRDAAARRRGQTDDTIFVDTERYGPAAEAQRKASASGGDSDDHERSVVIDPSLYEPAPDTESRQSIAPEQPAAPPTVPQATPATPAPPKATAPVAPRASTGHGGGAAAAPPSLGSRVAKLFLPQESGGEGKAPTYAQQQAAHRAEFTDDNQPAAGVERVNPHYSSPPGTPDQVVALQNEILNLLAVRARAEAESQHEGQRVEACEANRAPITATLATTHGGLGAVRAHEQAVARHDAANQAQQQRQQEAAAKTGGYGNQAAGMGVIEAPLAAWEGFTSLASHLPGSAGDKMAAMNAEAKKMQDAFGQMGAHMLGADGEQPARAASLADDSARIAATDAQAQASHQDLQSSADGAAGLQSANNATLAAAQQRQQLADKRSEELQSAADDRQAQADSLAAQMQAWAQAHRDERTQAVAATVARLQAQGKIVTQSPTE